jgi:hypothetical protein
MQQISQPHKKEDKILIQKMKVITVSFRVKKNIEKERQLRKKELEDL